jgi:hypothetical protein
VRQLTLNSTANLPLFQLLCRPNDGQGITVPLD